MYFFAVLQHTGIFVLNCCPYSANFHIEVNFVFAILCYEYMDLDNFSLVIIFCIENKLIVSVHYMDRRLLHFFF